MPKKSKFLQAIANMDERKIINVKPQPSANANQKEVQEIAMKAKDEFIENKLKSKIAKRRRKSIHESFSKEPETSVDGMRKVQEVK